MAKEGGGRAYSRSNDSRTLRLFGLLVKEGSCSMKSAGLYE